MIENDLYYNVVISLVKFINEFRGTISGANYLDWDEHANIAELPKDPILIGPAGCGLSEEEDGYNVVFSFGISTYEDKNLFTLRRTISSLFGQLTVGKRIPVYDAETGEEISWMVIKTPRAVTPVTKAEIRSLQFVEMNAKLELGATSSLR